MLQRHFTDTQFLLKHNSKMHRVYSILVCFILFNQVMTAQSFTWSQDIAPIIYENCSSCHHSGGIAPFSLMNYDEVRSLLLECNTAGLSKSDMFVKL